MDQEFLRGRRTAAAYRRQGVDRGVMAHIHQSATSRGMASLYAAVSLTAEPFFGKCGSVVEAHQQVERLGVVLGNAHMRKMLAPPLS